MTQTKKAQALAVFISGVVFGLAILTATKFLFSSTLAYSADTGQQKTTSIDEDNYYKYFIIFKKAYDILKQEYVQEDQTKARKLFYGAIKGMMESTGDPYTVFMEPSDSKNFTEQMSGSFGGLGITIDVRDHYLTVVSPIEDTPAWRAGIKPGDRIIEIDGKTTKDITIEEAMGKLRGKPGSKVIITIQRVGIKESFKLNLKREEIKIKTVKSDLITEGSRKTGYIRILEFSRPTGDEFKTALKDLLQKNPDSLIIDLRNNPGGLLDVVVQCANAFIPKGLIVYTKGRDPENNREYRAFSENTFVPMELPLVVMINQGSASASEIFAGAVQDTGRGVLVGTKSFGKGSVQNTFTFPDDGSLVKYTIAKYYTPSGVGIDKIGLKPQVESEIWYEKMTADEKESFLKLENTNLIKEWLVKTPAPDARTRQIWNEELKKGGFTVQPRTLNYLITRKENETKLPQIVDLEFDNQLRTALDVLTNYQTYKKSITYYQDVK